MRGWGTEGGTGHYPYHIWPELSRERKGFCPGDDPGVCSNTSPSYYPLQVFLNLGWGGTPMGNQVEAGVGWCPRPLVEGLPPDSRIKHIRLHINRHDPSPGTNSFSSSSRPGPTVQQRPPGRPGARGCPAAPPQAQRRRV
eukprot:324171-Hanusia_phi.AAC.3